MLDSSLFWPSRFRMLSGSSRSMSGCTVSFALHFLIHVDLFDLQRRVGLKCQDLAELTSPAVDKMMSKETKANLGPVQDKLITLGCGVVAGAAAAVLSQPADTLLSQINKGQGGEGGAIKKLAVLAREAGFVGLFSGLGPRIVMTAGL